MRKPSVIISILNWNNSPLTIRCVESLVAASYHKNLDFEILVVDNGSELDDKTALYDYLLLNKINFSVNDENLGFAGAHNNVLKSAVQRGVEFVWLLNNDCIVPSGALEALLEVMRTNESCGASSPVLAYEDNCEVYFSGAYQNWATLSSIWCPTPWDDEYHRQHQEELWLLGTALLLRIAAINVIGLLDKEFFAYCEDDDLGERLRLNSWRSIVARDVLIYHGPSPKVDFKRPPYFYYLTARNHTFFYLKYTPRKYRRFIRARLIAQSVHRSDSLAADGYPDLAYAVLAGLQDALNGSLGKPTPTKELSTMFKLLVMLFRAANGIHQSFRSIAGKLG